MGRLGNAAGKQATNAHLEKNSGRLVSLAKKKPEESKRWEFSFRFFKQVEFFGLSGAKVEPNWLVSLMERLAQLGKLTIEECIADPAKAQAYRVHPIDWSRKNVPIARKDLDWVDKIYLSDEENYPMRQFSVSTSMGRVVGFFDEKETFQIVLLDPLHNIQPSKDFDYAVDPCDPLDCELSQLKCAIESAIASSKPCEECGLSAVVRTALEKKTREHLPTILLTPVPDHVLKDVSAAMEMTGHSYSEIFLAGIDSVLGTTEEK